MLPPNCGESRRAGQSVEKRGASGQKPPDQGLGGT